MPRVFSPGNAMDVQIVSGDQAPGAPSFLTPPVFANGKITFSALLSQTDWDGSPLTGTNEFWVFGAYYNEDGTNPIDVLGGQALYDGGYLMQGKIVSEAMAAAGTPIPVSFAKADTPSGPFRIGIFTSDGTFE